MSRMSSDITPGNDGGLTPSALDRPVFVTFFADQFASRKSTAETSLRDLMPMIRDTVAETKGALPWLKLARFGDLRSDKNSFRFNENVIEIHGIEADYDGEKITLARAGQIVAQGGIAAVLYTSPSHTVEKPRWRVLCPTSRPYGIEYRARFLARINGLFVGALASESFTLSQSYYYGRVVGSTNHEVVAIEGLAIDLADDLDVDAIGKVEKARAPSVVSQPASIRLSKSGERPTGCSAYGMAVLEGEATAISTAGEGRKHHAVNRAGYVVGGLVPVHLTESVALAALYDALTSIQSQCKDYVAAEKTLVDAFAAGMGNPNTKPSPPHDSYTPPRYRDEPDENGEFLPIEIESEPPAPMDEGYWASVEADMAMSASDWHDLDQRESGRPIPASEAAHAAAGKNVLWAITEAWEDKAIPARPWIAKGYLMRGSVTVVSGPGSAGKSSLMVAWASALALGCPFHNFRSLEPMRVGTYNVEDDADEQKRRFSAMAIQLGVPVSRFMDRLAILGPQGIGTLLHMTPDGRLLVNTPVMDRLEEWVEAFGPDVLILDPFVELHAEEENDNTAVRAVMARFRSMAISYKMSIVLLHHARKGASTPGDPDSLRGASAIVGAARVALTLNVMTDEEADASNVAKDKRRDYFRLDGAKSNYAPIEEAEWFERKVLELANGDAVAAAWPWKPPSVFRDLPPDRINIVLDEIAAGIDGALYSATKAGRSNDRWCGQILIGAGLNDEQAKKIIYSWLQSGLLYRSSFRDPNTRKDREGVLVDNTKRPT